MRGQYNILQINYGTKNIGGVTTYLMNAYEYLNKDTYQFDFLSMGESTFTNYSSGIIKNGGNIYSLNVPLKMNKIKKNFVGSYRAYKFLKKHHYDMVQINSGLISFDVCMAIAAYFARVKSRVVFSHSTGIKKNKFKTTVQNLLKYVLDLVVTDRLAVSKDAGYWAFLKRRNKSGQVKIIKNGIDTQKFEFSKQKRDATRDALKIKDNQIVVGHIGRFSKEKNQIFIIELANKLKNNKNIVFICVGDGPTKATILEKIDVYELKEKVLILDQSLNVDEYYSAFDVFVFPSFFEGFGLSAVEAQISGLPVIANDTLPKDLKFNQFVDFQSIDDIDPWIDFILNNKNLDKRKQIGFDSILQVNQLKYDSLSALNKLYDFYDKKVASNGN